MNMTITYLSYQNDESYWNYYNMLTGEVFLRIYKDNSPPLMIANNIVEWDKTGVEVDIYGENYKHMRRNIEFNSKLIEDDDIRVIYKVIDGKIKQIGTIRHSNIEVKKGISWYFDIKLEDYIQKVIIRNESFKKLGL